MWAILRPMTDAARQPKPATSQTAARNAAVEAVLSLDDPGDFARASRGLIATHPTGAIEGPHGIAWDVSRHDFNRGDVPAPPSVNPSLWRQGRLNSIHGLFEVADGVWQVRGYDISNMTLHSERSRLADRRCLDDCRHCRGLLLSLPTMCSALARFRR